jgi:hypothetical protein
LQEFVSSWQAGNSEGVCFTTRVNHSLLSKSALTALQCIENENVSVAIGDLANIVIGVVTGANKFFVIDRKTAERWSLSEDTLTPIFSRFLFAKGINLELVDLDNAEKQNFRCLFVDSLKAP